MLAVLPLNKSFNISSVAALTVVPEMLHVRQSDSSRVAVLQKILMTGLPVV